MFNDIIQVLQNEIKQHIEKGHLTPEQFDRYIDYLLMLKANEVNGSIIISKSESRKHLRAL